MQRHARIATAAAVAGLVAWVFARRYALLSESPYPFGIDGYWYPIQLRALLDGGGLYYPSAPLALWWMAPFAVATDPITGAKLGAALGTALIAVPMYFVGRRVGGSRAAGLVAAVLAATSAESAYLATEFAKNGIAMTVAATYAAVLLWCLDRPGRGRIAACVGALVACALAHKTALAVAAIASIGPVAVAATGRVRAGLLVAAVSVVAAVVTVEHRVLAGMVTADADWSAAPLAVAQGTLHFGHEVLVAAALGILAVVAFARPAPDAPPARDRAACLGLAALAVFAAVPWLDAGDEQGIVFRLRLLAFVPLAVCGAAVAGAIARRGTRLWRILVPDAPERAAAIALIGFAVGLGASRPAAAEDGIVRAHPAMLAALQPLAAAVPADGVLVVPERHILYMATWYSGHPGRLRPEPVPADRRWRLIPLALMDEPLQVALDAARTEAVPGPRPRALHAGHRNGLVLVREATWQWVLGRLPDASRRHWTAWPTI